VRELQLLEGGVVDRREFIVLRREQDVMRQGVLGQRLQEDCGCINIRNTSLCKFIR